MKSIKECLINESAKPKYYVDTIANICDLFEFGPDGRYSLNSGDIEYTCKELMKALYRDNKEINNDSENGECDPTQEIKKLKAYIGEQITNALIRTCKLHYDNYVK